MQIRAQQVEELAMWCGINAPLFNALVNQKWLLEANNLSFFISFMLIPDDS